MLSRSSRVRTWSSATLAAGLVLALVPGAAAQPTSDEVRLDLRQAQQRLDEIDERLGLAVEEYNTAQVALEEIEARIAATQGELEELRSESQELVELVEEHVRRLHKMGPALELSTIVIAGDPTEASTKAWTMRRILEGQRTDLEALAANRTSVGAVEERALEEQEQAEQRAASQEEARAEVESLFASTQDEVAELSVLLEDTVAEERRRAEEERLRREAAEAAARAAAQEAARVAEREAERDREAEQATAAPSASTTATSGPSGGTTTSAPAPAPAEPAPAPSTRSSADVAVRTATAQLGKPYQWGGSGPNSFDCSGLTSYAWRAAGVTIPRTSGSQFSGTKRISRGELRPGDLVFYHAPISHVAMYIGNGQVVEAPNSGNNVRIRSDGLTRSGIVGYGRV